MHDDAVRDELIILAVAPGERACGRSQVSGVRCQGKPKPPRIISFPVDPRPKT
jgi:hypothetical protein